MRKITTTGLILVGLALPAPAAAQGNASIDQYLENTPSVGGGHGPDAGVVGGETGSRATGAHASAGDQVQVLAGRLASVAALTGAAAAQHGNARPQRAQPQRVSGFPSVAAASDGLFGGGAGMGAAFPVILVAAIVLALVAVSRRWRDREAGDPGSD